MTAVLAILGRAWAWLAGTKIGRITAAVAGALLAVFLIHRRGYNQGAEETREHIDEASSEAASQREKSRAEIDADVGSPGAADRLRDRWSRLAD